MAMPQWEVTLLAPGVELKAGMDSAATAGFDEGLDADAPPPPPEGGFSYFVGPPEHSKMAWDYRPTTEVLTSWTLRVDNRYTMGDAVMSWSMNGDPTGRAIVLRRAKDNETFNLRVPGSVTIPADELQVFYIEATIAPEPTETPTPSPTETQPAPTVTPEPTSTPLQPLDSDGDGFADEFERAHNSDPNDPASVPMALDLDGDGKLTVKDAMIYYRNRIGLIPVVPQQ